MDGRNGGAYVGGETEMIVDVAYCVTVGVGAVVVMAVTPMQEQADEYLTFPEQAEAYVGIANGATVTWRARIMASASRFAINEVTVATVTVVVLMKC